MAYSRTRAEEIALATAAPWWIAQAMAELEPVSEGTWLEKDATYDDQTEWRAERSRLGLRVFRNQRWTFRTSGTSADESGQPADGSGRPRRVLDSEQPLIWRSPGLPPTAWLNRGQARQLLAQLGYDDGMTDRALEVSAVPGQGYRYDLGDHRVRYDLGEQKWMITRWRVPDESGQPGA